MRLQRVSPSCCLLALTLRMLCGFMLVAFFRAPGSQGAQPLTAELVVSRIRENVNCTWQERTIDTFKAGDPATVITGIATTFMSTADVLKRAAAEGCNLIITHEPTFWAHSDQTKALEEDVNYQGKMRLINRHRLVVWRFHDHAHLHQPDLILTGMVRELGLDAHQVPGVPGLFRVPETTVGQFAGLLKQRLGAHSVDLVGHPGMKFSRVALAPGSPSSGKQMQWLAREDVEVLIGGETREWETIPYVQDAVALGRSKALILLGHANSEEAGMKHVADWMRTFVSEVPVKFIPAGDPFHDVP